MTLGVSFFTDAALELNHYQFPPGVECVSRNTPFDTALVKLLDQYNYQRVFVICSKTLNTKTDVIQRITSALGTRLIGVTDDVGEHAPLGNLLRAARLIADSKADVMVSVGGGSVLDFTKFVQLAIAEGAFTKEELLQFQWKADPTGAAFVSSAKSEPKIRQIAIPTTLSSAEWTGSGTPVDEDTRQKARLTAVKGAPQAIIYDPALLVHTPTKLLLSTGIRGLDHSINSFASIHPHPFVDLTALEAIRLYFANLPTLASDPGNLEALSACQLATWYTGMGQTSMAPLHGFSHWMVHVLAPYVNIGHSEAGAVMTLAQARWIEAIGTPHHARMLAAIGSPHSRFSDALHDLLISLRLPVSLRELGVTPQQVEEMLPIAMRHPNLRRFNLRPIETADDIRAVMALAA